MTKLLDFLLVLLAQFAGGPGGIENNLMRFGLAAVFWGLLLVVAWSRQRKDELPREEWLVWGFGLGLARELFMFSSVSLQMLDVIKLESVYFISAPLEHALAMAAVVMVAGSFLRYILDDATLSRRYLQIGLGATGICYLATSLWWALYAIANPGSRFGQSWGGWLFRVAASVLIAVAIVSLAKRRGWLRNVVLVALTFFFMNEFLLLFNSRLRARPIRMFAAPSLTAFIFWSFPCWGTSISANSPLRGRKRWMRCGKVKHDFGESLRVPRRATFTWIETAGFNTSMTPGCVCTDTL